MNDRARLDRLSEAQLRQRLANGDLSDEEFQEAMRRKAASRRPEDLPDSTDHTTAEGFGSGQGMEHSDMGQGPEPDIPDERGFPRTEEESEEWPT